MWHGRIDQSTVLNTIRPNYVTSQPDLRKSPEYYRVIALNFDLTS